MKKVFLSFLAGFFCFVFAFRAEAQNTNLSVSQLINFPDTIFEGVPYDSILVVVVNNDSISAYQGPISISMLADSSNNPVQLSSGSSNVLLFPGDTIIFTVNNYFFDPSAFKAGENIVVVWPIANTDIDSLYVDVYYVHMTGITDYFSSTELYISPNPATDKVNIIITPETSFEQVRIYSYDGKLVGDLEVEKQTITVAHLSKGVYFIYFYHRHGISIRKFIKH